MGFLTMSLGIVGAGLLINLALTFALLRRVRRHGEQLARFPFKMFDSAMMGDGLRAGSKVPDLKVRTVSGETRSLAGTGGTHSVIGFFSVGCPSCEKQLPEFKEYARTIPGGVSQVLAVISGNEAAAAGFARELEGVAEVVLEPHRGSVQQAMSVSTFPALYLLDAGGQVQIFGRSVQRLSRASLATAQAPR
jgi:peroxiredoxin